MHNRTWSLCMRRNRLISCVFMQVFYLCILIVIMPVIHSGICYIWHDFFNFYCTVLVTLLIKTKHICLLSSFAEEIFGLCHKKLHEYLKVWLLLFCQQWIYCTFENCRSILSFRSCPFINKIKVTNSVWPWMWVVVISGTLKSIYRKQASPSKLRASRSSQAVVKENHWR